MAGFKLTDKHLEPIWHLYILKGAVGYYVGISTRVEERLKDHQKGTGYFSSRLGDPAKLELVRTWFIGEYVQASKFERWLGRNLDVMEILVKEPGLKEYFFMHKIQEVKNNLLENVVLKRLRERAPADKPAR